MRPMADTEAGVRVGAGIGEASRACGVTPATLRYYEEQGLVPPVPRDGAGRRRYDDAELGWARYAVCLRSLGLGVQEIARYVAAARDPGRRGEQAALLEDHVAAMTARRAELDHFLAITQAKLALLRDAP